MLSPTLVPATGICDAFQDKSWRRTEVMVECPAEAQCRCSSNGVLHPAIPLDPCHMLLWVPPLRRRTKKITSVLISNNVCFGLGTAKELKNRCKGQSTLTVPVPGFGNLSVPIYFYFIWFSFLLLIGLMVCAFYFKQFWSFGEVNGSYISTETKIDHFSFSL